MCKNEIFQNLESKNEIFKVQERKTNFIQSFRTKKIVYPKKKYKRLLNVMSLLSFFGSLLL